jgi:hypothetical protein
MTRIIAPLLLLLFSCQATAQENSYNDLLQLFAEWREFESPPLLDGAPDYTAETFAERYEVFKGLQAELNGFEITEWPVAQQVDWHLVQAEMNGYDFNHQ